MRQRRTLIVIVAGVVAVLLVIAVLIMPRLSKIHTVNGELIAAQAKQSSLETQLAQLQDIGARAKAIRTKLDLLDAAVPSTSNLPDLIRMLNDVADQSAVDFVSIAPSQPVPVNVSSGVTGPADAASPAPPPVVTGGESLPEGISIMPLSITVNGSYFAIDEYLFRLETLPRISKVTTLGLAVGAGGYPNLILAIAVNFYTTDVSSGPGSQPGSQSAGGVVVPPSPLPSATTTPTATPSS